jgi:ribonuclease HI
MTHVLTQCNCPGQELVWNLVSELWEKRTGYEHKPTMGEIMACGTIKKGDSDEKTDAGTSRLYRIVIAESAHLIWCLRNERVIQEKNPASAPEIHNRWRKKLNDRIRLDRLLTNKNKYGNKSIPKSLVRRTWKKIVENEDESQAHWMQGTGVLVGIG